MTAKVCGNCGGTGSVTVYMGGKAWVMPCRTCGGTGQVNDG